MNILFFTSTNNAKQGHGDAAATDPHAIQNAWAAQGHDVRQVCTDVRSQAVSRLYDANNVINARDEASVLAASETVDAIVYQLGNRPERFEGALPWIARLPGLLLLEDTDLSGLPIANSPVSVDAPTRPLRLPLETRHIAASARAILVPDDLHLGELKQICRGPVEVARDFAFLPAETLLASTKSSDSERPYATRPLRLLMTDWKIDADTGAEVVIRAISRNEFLRRRVVLQIVGPSSSEVFLELASLAANLQVSVRLFDSPDRVAADQAVAEADLLCDLRQPRSDTLPSRTIEAMAYGKAIITVAHPARASIPDGTIHCITAAYGIDDVMYALLHLCDVHPNGDNDVRNRRITMGKKAADWVLRQRSINSARYAQQAVRLAEKVGIAYTGAAARVYFSQLAESWGVSADSALLAQVWEAPLLARAGD